MIPPLESSDTTLRVVLFAVTRSTSSGLAARVYYRGRNNSSCPVQTVRPDVLALRVALLQAELFFDILPFL